MGQEQGRHIRWGILALLIEQAKGAPLSIALAAPTGKAAARLTDMVRAIKEELNCPSEVKALIPETAFTIHRLLGPIYGEKPSGIMKQTAFLSMLL